VGTYVLREVLKPDFIATAPTSALSRLRIRIIV
jgi:hypothetical protein